MVATRRLLAFPLAAALAVLPAAPAAAQLLTLVSDGRYVLVDHCPAFEPCQTETERPPGSFAAFDGEAEIAGMGASQTSSPIGAADPSAMSGSLASASPDEPPLGNTLGEAVFDVTFEPGTAASYAWTGAGAISGGGYGGAFLYDLTSDTVLFETSLPAGFDESGRLEAGHRYRIFHHATTLGQGSADWELAFQVMPEPGLAVPLASGLALAGLLGRRRTAATPRGLRLCARRTKSASRLR